LKAAREKHKVTNKDNPIRIVADVSTKTQKSKEGIELYIPSPIENNSQPKLIYPVKLSFIIEGEIFLNP
jgi:hypothetical protein